MVVATYFYYEKVRKTMRAAIVLNLLNLYEVRIKRDILSGHLFSFMD